MKPTVPIALLLLASGSLAHAQETALPSPFASAEVDAGWLELHLRPEGLAALAAAHAEDRTVALTDFALPGGRRVELALRPVRAMPRGASALVAGPDGATSRLAPSIATFAGHVRGEGGSAFLGVSGSMAHGYVRAGGELYILSSGPATAGGPWTLAPAALLPLSPLVDLLCSVDERALAAPSSGAGQQAGTGGPFVRIADVFVELDHEYRGLYASDQDAIDYATLLWTASSEIYRRDLGAVLHIPDGYMRLWTTVPPWGVITGFGDIQNVANYWQNPHNPLVNLPRASVHVLTTPVFGGVAMAIGGLCTTNLGYEVSSVYGFFPYPIEHTDPNNWDLLVVTHEYGHTFGSPHTFDYNPPIDCVDGSGPDEGTLMSYCHLSQGLENVGMRFHARVQEVIRDYLATSTTCLTWLMIAPGDYDYDGAVEADDLAVLDACLAQGFHSEGCLETFDLDGDGQLTPCDRNLMAELVDGPGAISCIAPGACPCGNDGGCAGCANSTGSGGTLTGSGSASTGADDLVLTAAGLPAGQNAIFFMAEGQTQLPLGDGLRCAGGQAFRFPILNTGAGTAQLGPGIVAASLSSFPPAGQIGPGDSFAFQLWHRDPAGPCGQNSNLSPAYRVDFTP